MHGSNLLDSLALGISFNTETGELMRSDENKGILRIPTHIDGVPVSVIGKKLFSEHLLSQVFIPENVLEIKAGAFERNLIYSVIFSEGLETIGENVFLKNYIEELELPSSINTIGKNAFSQNKLRELVIPEGIQEIYSGAFSFNSLTTVDLPKGIKHLDSDVFSNNSEGLTIICHQYSYGEAFALEQGYAIEYKDEDLTLRSSSIF